MQTAQNYVKNTMLKNAKSFLLLLIEDNPGDVRLTQEAFKEIKQNISLEVVMDGVDALRYLRKEEPFTDKILPDLILLDLNLPKMDGREVIREIKADPYLRQIPIVVLTTSNARQDIINSYSLYANCFINKPVDFDQFFTIIQKIVDFWLLTAELPSLPASMNNNPHFYQSIS
ncbi:MAG TPA: response regulator [Flavilitoribacter sp.]|nr:response regulator [Flavilitoribacter sp.]HMQ88335.1 response regulator [Flavilitoribacter sp.]